MPRHDDDGDADNDVDAERASYVDAWESVLGFELGLGLQSAEGRESGAAAAVSAVATLLCRCC